MDIPPLGYGILGISVVIAVLVDYAVVAGLLSFLRPPSAHAFWIGRAGKLLSIALWCIFLNEYWMPGYLPRATFVPMVRMGEMITLGALAVIALATYPRSGRI